MTSQVSSSVGSSKNGSMLAVFGSGISSMSDASMPFQPAIEEPSKAWPPVNLSSSKCDRGTVTCCSLPRVSVKRKSTNLTSFSDTNFITSATVLAAIKNLLARRYLVLGWVGTIEEAHTDRVPQKCAQECSRNHTKNPASAARVAHEGCVGALQD